MMLPHKLLCEVTFKDMEGWKTKIMQLAGVFDNDSQPYYFVDPDGKGSTYASKCRPYLRSLFDMTHEERVELDEMGFSTETCVLRNYLGIEPNFFGILASKEFDKSICSEHSKGASIKDVMTYVIWLIEHRFDIFGLIEQDMAEEATKDMYK